MNIHLDTDTLKPATLACIIDDMLDNPDIESDFIAALIEQLEIHVGDVEAMAFLIDLDVTPQRLEARGL